MKEFFNDMRDDTKLGLIWALACLLAVVVIVVSANMYYTGKTRDSLLMQQKGFSAVEINCALNDENGKLPSCIILSMKDK